MNRIILSIWLCCYFTSDGQGINRFTLENIWQQGTFRAKTIQSINWSLNGKFYTSLVPNLTTNKQDIIKYNLVNGGIEDTLVKGHLLKTPNVKELNIDTYEMNPKENEILIATATENIYRYSNKSTYYLYNLNTKVCLLLLNGRKISDVTFSPDGKNIAYTYDNNLYYLDQQKVEHAITTNGIKNKIINGHGDWVYEEEYELSKAFQWSPDSKQIAFCTFNESAVKEYELQTWQDQLYPQLYKYKYPKAGEENSKVNIRIYEIETQKTLEIPLNNDAYIPKITWTSEAGVLCIVQQNRLQNIKQLLHYNIAENKIENILTESDSAYVEINDDLYYLQDKTHLIYSSEINGFRHLYLYNYHTKFNKPITTGNWEVHKLEGVDEVNKKLFFTSNEKGASERQLYSINYEGKNKEAIIKTEGVNEIQISPDFKYFINKHTTINQPADFSVYSINGRQIRVIEDNKLIKEKIALYKPAEIIFFKIANSNNQLLNAWIMKPVDFDSTKKYPVLIYVYGGPGHQTVLNAWMGANYYWFQLLAQKGYIIVSVDGRGTGGMGAKFKKSTYAQLGKLECEDVIATAKYLGQLNFVDKTRIGIFGWSFGGYLSSLAITLGADFFKMAVAVAPVTNWRFYDSIYTERFLKTPQENPQGYDDNSPISHANKLRGHYLIIHGSGDDNVHVQHTMAMINALVSNNKKFSSMIYPDKNHGIYGGNTRLHLYQLMTDFIFEKL